MPATAVTKPTLIIALLLLALMAATRFHHFGSAMHLPDASLMHRATNDGGRP